MKVYGTKEEKMRHGSHGIVLGVAAVLVLAGGCKTADDYRKERVKNAVEQFNQSKKTELVKDKEVLTLHDCMALAAKHNLELKVQNLEKDAAKNIMMA